MGKKIIILGSKPNAKIEDADIYYIANSAGSYYKDELKDKNGVKYLLVAASEISKSTRVNKNKELWLEEKFQRIISTEVNKIILIGNEYFPETLEKLNNEVNIDIEILSLKNLSRMLHSVFQLNIPLITPYHWLYTDINSIKNIYKYIKDCYRFYLKNEFIGGLFRPSTGLISLVYAIHNNSVKDKYLIKGIGLNNREIYPDNFNNTWTPTNIMKQNHVYCDKYISKMALTSKYDVNFEDESFMS